MCGVAHSRLFLYVNIRDTDSTPWKTGRGEGVKPDEASSQDSEELCALQSNDLDPAHRMLRVRAEVAKGARQRTVPCSATSGELLRAYLAPYSAKNPSDQEREDFRAVVHN